MGSRSDRENRSETGFEGVELRTGHAHGVELDLGVKSGPPCRARFADSAVEIVGLGSVFEYDTPDESELKANYCIQRIHTPCPRLGRWGN